MNDNLCCKVCKKYFTRPYNLKLHIKNFHPEILPSQHEFQSSRAKFNQKCPLCDYLSNVRLNIEKHLLTVHNIIELNDCKILYFSSKDEFLKWKSHLERSTNTLFVQLCGAQYVKQVKTTYYYCNRSGYFSPKGQGKRALRVKGSSKINGVCPAKIKMFEKSSKEFEVHFTDCHLGHDREICHTYIPKKERDEIALKISRNVPFEQILQELREAAESDETLEKLKLITKKDLWNIKYSHVSPLRTYSSLKLGDESSSVVNYQIENDCMIVAETVEPEHMV